MFKFCRKRINILKLQRHNRKWTNKTLLTCRYPYGLTYWWTKSSDNLRESWRICCQLKMPSLGVSKPEHRWFWDRWTCHKKSQNKSWFLEGKKNQEIGRHRYKSNFINALFGDIKRSVKWREFKCSQHLRIWCWSDAL